jgi:hypothetical protein
MYRKRLIKNRDSDLVIRPHQVYTTDIEYIIRNINILLSSNFRVQNVMATRLDFNWQMTYTAVP